MYYVDKQPIWSGTPRNIGIEKAIGEYIIYLDADDTYEPDYLDKVNQAITDLDWYFVDDIIYKNGLWVRRKCSVKIGQCGTSNVIHKRQLGSLWNEDDTYAHDWNFIQNLKRKSNSFKTLDLAGYVVMHIPRRYDK